MHTIRVRRGIGNARYCACDNAGNPIRGFNKLLDICKYWKKEIRRGYIKLICELDKKPDMDMVDDTIRMIDSILRA